MRNFHSITIGTILIQLKNEGVSTLERSTLNRLEKKLGFAKEGRKPTEWRLFSPAKALAFKIAVLNYYDKPLPKELAELAQEPKVIEELEKAREQAQKLLQQAAPESVNI